MDESKNDELKNDESKNDELKNDESKNDEWEIRQFYFLYRFLKNTEVHNNLNEIREKSRIDRIHVDVWAIVLGRYGYMSANSLARTCKLFNKAVYKEQFWKMAIPVTLKNIYLTYEDMNYYDNNKQHMCMILDYIQSHFFNKNISEKPVDFFSFLKWIFDSDYIHIKLHEEGCSVHFRNVDRKSVLVYFVGHENIKTLVRGKVKTTNWPMHYNIGRSVYMHHPFNNNVKIAYYFITNLRFIPHYIEYYYNGRDNNEKNMFCGMGCYDEYGLIMPGKKGRRISDHEYK